MGWRNSLKYAQGESGYKVVGHRLRYRNNLRGDGIGPLPWTKTFGSCCGVRVVVEKPADKIPW